MEEEFKEALAFSNNQSNDIQTSNEQKLQFYALFKQATQGAPKGEAPSRLKVVERAKFMAWKQKENLTKEQAMQEYIDLLTSIAPNWKQTPKL